jgi:hypothetical protein
MPLVAHRDGRSRAFKIRRPFPVRVVEPRPGIEPYLDFAGDLAESLNELHRQMQKLVKLTVCERGRK